MVSVCQYNSINIDGQEENALTAEKNVPSVGDSSVSEDDEFYPEGF